ncbi:MAG: hypothetical protein JWM92_326 [Candidatus Nomurabacteria bacterium]|nr:hypothetical protein [Candidatus Nomurabacteria bacterium]
MTPFNFSIRTALKQSWHSFAAHPAFFTSMAFVMVIFNLFTFTHNTTLTPQHTVLLIVVFIAVILWSYVWISVSLAAVDGKDDLLNYKSLSLHMPNVRQFFTMIVIGIAVGIIVGVGFVLLIIPGIYFLVRLAFATIAYVDRQNGVMQSLSYSWHLVKGKIFWTVFLVLMIAGILTVLGSITLMIGLLITYPIAMLLIANLYRALTNSYKNGMV